MLDTSGLSREDKLRLLELLAEKERREAQRVFFKLFPDETVIDPATGEVERVPCAAAPDGVLRYGRELYPKHIEFFSAGAEYPERLALAANRVGKTMTMGGYEVTCHLTGLYPDWWPGRRYDRPTSWWVAGKSYKTTRDILQLTMLGEVLGSGPTKRISGTGVVPGVTIGDISWGQGVADLVDTVRIKHVSGGWSDLGFKAFEQGRGAFEGTAKDGIWLDEECPMDVYGECLIRTTTTRGMVILTFTPLEGITPLVRSFIMPDTEPEFSAGD